MKKKILVLVAALLCVVTVLSACAGSMSFGRVVGDGVYNDSNPTLTTGGIVEIAGTTKQEGNLILFNDVNEETGLSTYKVYNLATNTVVWTGTDTLTESGETVTATGYEVELARYEDISWFMVCAVTETRTAADDDESVAWSLRDANGTEFATSTNKYADEPETAANLIRFDGKVYRIAEDGTIAYAFDSNAFAYFPTLEMDTETVSNLVEAGENYIYATYNTSSRKVTRIESFDEELNLTGVYVAPSYAEGTQIFPLNGGKVLVQYRVELGIMAEEYDYSVEGCRYDLVTAVINPANGKVKEIDLDVVIVNLVTKKDADDWKVSGLNEKIENAAVVYEIVDGQLDTSITAHKTAVLNNNGKVKGFIDEKLLPAVNASEIKLVAENRWLVSNLAGQKLVVNEKGDIVADVTDVAADDMTSTYFIYDGKIYNWNMEVKFDSYAEDADIRHQMAHSVVYKNDEGALLLYNGVDGTTKTIVDKDASVEFQYINESFYALVTTADDGKKNLQIFNDLGALIGNFDNMDTYHYVGATADNKAVMFKVEIAADGETPAKTIYYRVA